MIRVLFFPPGLPAEVRKIKQSWKDVAALVGGFFDRARVSATLHLYVHDEGLLDGMSPNVRAPTYPQSLHGPAVLIAEDGEDWRSLTDEELAWGMTFERFGLVQ